MRAFIMGIGLTAIAAMACGTSAEEVDASEGAATEAEIRSAFDVNDVSILFPLDANGEPYPKITLTDKRRAKVPYINPTAFQTILSRAASAASYSSWRMWGDGFSTPEARAPRSKASAGERPLEASNVVPNDSLPPSTDPI